MSGDSPSLISIVIPVYREAENLEFLVKRLDQVTSHVPDCRWEYVFVNDGSPDDSFAVLARLAARDARIKVVDLSRNFGKEIALSAGVRFASGAAAICMDADLQHPPELIPELVAAWRGGAEVVVGVRRSSAREPLLRRIGSRIFNTAMKRLSDYDYVAHATDFRLIDRSVLEVLNQIGERARIFRGLVDWLGFRRAIVEFDAPARERGRPSYSFGRLWTLALDSFTSASAVPLRFVGYLGALITLGSAALLVWMFIAEDLISPRFYYTPLARVVVANTLLIGIVLVALGAMSLYLAKIHAEILDRPLYAVRRVLNIERRRSAEPAELPIEIEHR